MRLVFLAGLFTAVLVAAAPVEEEKRQTSVLTLPPTTFTGIVPRPTGTRSRRPRPTGTGVVELPTGSHTRRPRPSFTGSFEVPTGAPTFAGYPPMSTALVARDGVDSDAPTSRAHSQAPRPTRTRAAGGRPTGTRAAGGRPTGARPTGPARTRPTGTGGRAVHRPSSTGSPVVQFPPAIPSDDSTDADPTLEIDPESSE